MSDANECHSLRVAATHLEVRATDLAELTRNAVALRGGCGSSRQLLGLLAHHGDRAGDLHYLPIDDLLDSLEDAVRAYFEERREFKRIVQPSEEVA